MVDTAATTDAVVSIVEDTLVVQRK